jgi:O-antigen/teichoic acid export membrane protein
LSAPEHAPTSPTAADPTEPPPVEESLSGTVLNGGKWLGMAALAQALLQIVVIAVLARLLSPAEFGLAAIAGIFIDLASGIAAMGTSQALVQRHELTGHHIRAAFTISMVMGLAATLALFFSSGWLAHVLGNPAAAPLIAALSLTFVITAVSFVPQGLASRRLNFRILAVRQLVGYLIGYGVFGIASALLGAGAWALVYAQIAQASMVTILLVAAIRFDPRPTRDWAAHKEILGFGSGFSFARIANSLTNQVDRVIVSMNTNATAVGLYTRALQISRYPTTLIGQVIEDVLFPSFAGVQTDRERLNGAYYRSIGSIFIILTPVSVFFCLAARPLTDILLGRQWENVVPLLVAFGVTIPVRSAQRVSSAVLRAVGHSWLIAALQLFLLISTVIGAIIGIRYGLLGAAIAVTGAFILHYIALAIACVLVLKLKAGRLLGRHFAGVPLGIVAASGPGVGIAIADSVPALIALILSTLIAIVLALAAVLAKPRWFLGKDGQWLASLVLSKAPRKWREVSMVSALAGRIAR